MDSAFKFVKNHGLATEASYPYKGVDGKCNIKAEANAAVHITGYQDVLANSEASLLKATANQPVSVAIDAGDFNSSSTRAEYSPGHVERSSTTVLPSLVMGQTPMGPSTGW
ncbi:hypothetical protein MLD38_003053 [Melastoma candidum]|nr:hypothetical protein MLD38_003053 [Melastoma candidum]